MNRIFIFLSLCLIASTLGAQNKLDSIQPLGEVVITRTQIAKEIVPVQSLSGEELQKLSAHSVADALRYFSGVQIKDYGGVGGFKTVNIRSLGSEHVGVFYDGIEIGNAQNGVVDLGRFSLDNMEIISLYNGQKSVIFQAAKDFASASSIYMVAKKPEFRADKDYNMKATMKAGSFAYVNPSILWEQKLSKNVSSSFNADYTYSDGKYKFRRKVKNSYDTTMTRHNGDIDVWRLEQSLFGNIKGGEWKTKAYFYNSERGLPGAVVKQSSTLFRNSGRQWDRNFFLQGSIKKRFSKSYSSELRAKYAYDYMRYESLPSPTNDIIHPINNKYKLQEAYLSSANMFNILPFWSINLAADYQYNKLNANLNEFSYPTRHSAWAALATSLYFEKVKIQGSLLATYAHESFTQDDYRENPITGESEYAGSIQTNKNWDKYTPTIIIAYQPWLDHDFHVRAFYKKIFRLPTFNEIYYTILGSGTSQLRPENTTQYNLGLTYSKPFYNSFFSHIGAQVDAYYNEVTDKILAIPGGMAFRWTMMNIGLVKIKGIETNLETGLKWTKDLKTDVRLSYTYQKAQDYSNPELGADGKHKNTYKGQIAYIPWHSGSAVISTNYKGWDLNYSFVYAGKRYTSSENNDKKYLVLAWYTHDLALAKSLRWQKTDFRLTAEVNNILNQQYDIVQNYPMPGTNFKFIVSTTF